ncbi:TonB-dependent receptor [Bacteroides sp.]|uniref:SusC/RagA family TonB-linked outer membrane protein n=1 Tax=Bacteroides sp. TaxID=29523 RepID=UPI0025BC5A5B|nr:TonB-dependent receptor [Bacteroides sp.]
MKKKKKRLPRIAIRFLCIFMGLCSVLDVFAQQVLVSGNIVDDTGVSVIGASVLEKGTTNGTITDIDGKFSISVSKESTLVVSFVGYSTQEIPVQGKTFFDIVLKEDSEVLDEVVVVGYGTMKKNDLTGAISSVSAKDLGKQPSSSLGAALQGRATGLQVISNGAPGDNVSMKIRGIGSIVGSDPLLVIDGVPTDVPLNMINMNDVETVNVLKDASATAIYGSRGAYGVIIITTKKGKANSTPRFEFKASYGIESVKRTLDLLDATQFASLHNEMMTANAQPQNPLFEDPTLLGKGTDWVNELFQTGATQDYSLSYSGGNDKTTYYVSAAYFTQDGIVRTTEYDRFTVQFNMDTQLFKWLKMGNKLSLNHDVKAKGEYNIKNTMLALPTQEIKNEDGSWAGPVGQAMYVGDIANPIGKMYSNTSCTKGYNMLGNIYAEITPWEWLTFKSIAGVQALFWDEKGWAPKYDWEPIAQEESYASRKYNKSLTILWDNTLTFNKTFNDKHVLTAMIGSSAQTNTYEYMGGSIMGFISPTAQQLDNGTLEPNVYGNGSDWALLSLLGRINYTYDNKYLLTATVRRDGSSRFSKQNRWANFPSVALAWRLSEEPFFKKSFWLSDMKLRAGYGLTGNQASVGNYVYASVWQTIQYNFNGNQVNAIAPSVMPNPNVRWEEVEQYNIGADLTMFNDRVNLSLDAYVKNTNDMLVDMSVPISTGFSDVYVPKINAGKMRNKGFEISMTSRNMLGEFSWMTTVNASYNTNKILSLNGDVPIYFGNNIHAVGHPASSFYGYVVDGIFQTQEEVDNHAIQTAGDDPYNRTSAGDIRFKDLNNDGIINDDDRTFLGDPTPSWTFSMNNSFAWKNFDLEVYFQGVAGNKIYNSNRASLEAMSVAQNQMTTVLERWRGEGTSDSMPRAVFGDPNKNTRTSNRFIEDGSYLRLKNITLGYTLPERISKKALMSSVRFYVSGQNLLTLTRYTGLDPEISSGTGDDNNVYPVSRNITFGLNVSF